MTGVFHFIAISFGLILAGRKLESPAKAVNQALRHTLPFGYAILSTLAAFLGVPPHLAASESDAVLARCKVVLFLNATGDVLD